MIEQGKVTISLEGRCVCPNHGTLGPEVEYQAGRAECGCEWVTGPDDGILLVEVANVATLRNEKATVCMCESS